MSALGRNRLTDEQQNLRRRPSVALAGLLILEILIGYEWLISGLTKVIRGDFSSGLADQLADKVAAVPGWYADFFKGVVIPNAPVFGYVIEVAELLVGFALVVGPLLWLFAWDRIPSRLQSAVVLLLTAASIGAIFMALNFHLANGNSHPWLIPQDSFDEGVDFDSLLAILNIVTATVNAVFLTQMRASETKPASIKASVAQAHGS